MRRFNLCCTSYGSICGPASLVCVSLLGIGLASCGNANERGINITLAISDSSNIEFLTKSGVDSISVGYPVSRAVVIGDDKVLYESPGTGQLTVQSSSTSKVIPFHEAYDALCLTANKHHCMFVKRNATSGITTSWKIDLVNGHFEKLDGFYIAKGDVLLGLAQIQNGLLLKSVSINEPDRTENLSKFKYSEIDNVMGLDYFSQSALITFKSHTVEVSANHLVRTLNRSPIGTYFSGGTYLDDGKHYAVIEVPLKLGAQRLRVFNRQTGAEVFTKEGGNYFPPIHSGKEVETLRIFAKKRSM